MTADEDVWKAIRWLRGRDNNSELVRTVSGDRIVSHLGAAEGRKALLRILRSDQPLNADLRNTLANAFELVGCSPLRAEVVLTRRKRGAPQKRAVAAVAGEKLSNKIQEHEKTLEKELDSDRVQDLAVRDAVREAGRSRALGYSAKAAKKRAKEAKG